MKMDSEVYFMTIAFAAATRSTCPRRSVGAVLIANKRVVSTGYNGAPSGFRECINGGCVMFQDADRERCINTVHAEVNALTSAHTKGDLLVCTDAPCINCVKNALAHNVDIKIIYARDYTDAARDVFLKENGMEDRLIKFDSRRLGRILSLMEQEISK